MTTKVNKSTAISRKGNGLRLSLRRFSHQGGTNSSSKAAKIESGLSDLNFSMLDSEVYSWTSCQKSIIRIAQGQKVDPDKRVRISVSLRNLASENKNLANGLRVELFGTSGLQKAFRDLAATFDSGPVKSIAALWIQFYSVVLPDLHAVLYPFEEANRFDIRKMILVAFRDALISDEDLCYGVLDNGNGVKINPVVQQMLLILENTRDGTGSYTKIRHLCERVDGFSSLEIGMDPLLTPNPLFYLENADTPRQQSTSPRPLHRLMRRAKGSVSAMASDQSDLTAGGLLNARPWQQGRSRSPIGQDEKRSGWKHTIRYAQKT